MTVTYEGDDSHVDRIFVCGPDVKDCVVSRQSGDPAAPRASGPWTVALTAPGSNPPEVEIYAVNVNDKVRPKQRVPVDWSNAVSDDKCTTLSTSAVTMSLPAG